VSSERKKERAREKREYKQNDKDKMLEICWEFSEVITEQMS